METLAPSYRGRVWLMVQTTTLQRALKGQSVTPSRLGWVPIRLLKGWNFAFSRRKGMKKGRLSVAKLIPGRPRSVKFPDGFSASYLFNASCWWSHKENSRNSRQLPAGPEVEEAFPTQDGSTSLRLKQRLDFRAAVSTPQPHLERFLFPLNFNQLCYIFCLQKDRNRFPRSL